MKRVTLGLALMLALAVSGCKCPAQKQAIKEIRDTQALVFPEYLEYVSADGDLSSDDKDDRVKLVESLNRMTKKFEDSLDK